MSESVTLRLDVDQILEVGGQPIEILKRLGQKYLEKANKSSIEDLEYTHNCIDQIIKEQYIYFEEDDKLIAYDILIYTAIFIEYTKTEHLSMFSILSKYKDILSIRSDTVFRGRIYRLSANVYKHAGILDQAIKNANKAYAIFEDKDLVEETMSSLLTLGNCYNSSDNLMSEYKYYEEVIDLASKSDNPYFKVTAMNNIAHVASEMGDYEKAYSQIKKAIQLLEEIEDSYHLIWYQVTHSEILYGLTRYQEAYDNLMLIKDAEYLNGHNYIQLEYNLLLIKCLLKLDQIDSLDSIINQSIEIAHEMKLDQYLIKIYEQKSLYYKHIEDYKEAYTYQIKCNDLRKALEVQKLNLQSQLLKIKYDTEKTKKQNVKLNALTYQLTQELSEAHNALVDTKQVTIYAMAALAEVRDKVTGKHVFRTTEYVKVLCDLLVKEGYYCDVLNPEIIKTLSRASALHDIGKIAVPDHILNKKGSLTPEEFNQIKLHASLGEYSISIVETLLGIDTYMSMAKTICASHHEKWNGRGYPQGLSEENIPLEGRIVAIIDVYDALVSKRPYKEAYSHEKAISIIEKESGKHFDPKILEVFLKHHQVFEKIALANKDQEAPE